MKSIVAVLIFCIFSLPASAWDEKWPVEIKLNQSNFLSEFLRANFGKVGEIAAKRLDDILNDPVKQAKLAASTIRKLNDLYDEYQRDRSANEVAARDAAARAFIALVEADIGLFVAPMGGAYNVQAGYSAKYGVTRLTWDRQISRSQCQRSVCSCPNGSSVPGPGFFCYTNTPFGQSSQPASCSFPIDYVDTEAEYKVYRNSKLIATFAGAKSVSSANTNSIGGSIGPISLTLSTSVPPSALGPAGRAGPFYDFDPQNENFGTPLIYRIEARSAGCSEAYAPGRFYNNQFVGVISGSSTLSVDADGDARPDYYPPGPFLNARLDSSSHVSLYNPTEYGVVWYWEAAYQNLRTTITGISPGGTVKYYVGGQLVATGNVVNGVSEMPLGTLKPQDVDQFDVIASYSGDANNPPGSSSITYVALYRD